MGTPRISCNWKLVLTTRVDMFRWLGILCVCAVCSVMSDSAPCWSVARQAPLFLGYSKQEHWSRLQCPPPGDLPNPGIEPASPALQVVPLPLSHWGSPGILYSLLIFDWFSHGSDSTSIQNPHINLVRQDSFLFLHLKKLECREVKGGKT